MSDAPDRIWLQDDGKWSEDAHLHGEITWCQDKINDGDTEYIKSSLVPAHVLAEIIKAGKDRG